MEKTRRLQDSGGSGAEARSDSGLVGPGAQSRSGGSLVPAEAARTPQSDAGHEGGTSSVLQIGLDAALLAALTLVLLWPRAGAKDFWFSDASRHALDGVFFIDLLQEGGLLSPYDYALCYHARFPALGLAYYPPLFAIVEAVVYLLVGIGYSAARATVLLFGLVAVLAGYALGRRLGGRRFGIIAAVAFVTMPTVVYWASDVMLELPAAAMTILTVLFLHEWVDRGRRWAIFAAAAFAVGSVLTKQPTAYVILLIPAYALVRRRPRLLISGDAVVCCVAAALVLTPYLAFQMKVYPAGFRGLAGSGGGAHFSLERWTYFFEELPSLATWPVIGLAGVGILACVCRGSGPSAWLPVCWFATAYVFTACAVPRLSRYLYLVLPPVGLLAATGAVSLPIRSRVGRSVWAGIVGFALAYQGWRAAVTEVPWVSGGIRRAAAFVSARPVGETVLYHGYLSGNFAYHMRVEGGPRARTVLRSDKLLGRYKRIPQRRFEPGVSTREELAAMLERHGVGHVVVEPGDCSEARAVTPLLLEVLRRAPWRLAARVPLRTHRVRAIGGDILIFENPGAGAATARFIPMWVPLSRSDLRVEYDSVRYWRSRSTDR